MMIEVIEHALKHKIRSESESSIQIRFKKTKTKTKQSRKINFSNFDNLP